MFLPFQVLYVIEEIASGRTENENASGKVMVFYKPSTSTFPFIVPIVFGKKNVYSKLARFCSTNQTTKKKVFKVHEEIYIYVECGKLFK